MCFFNHTLDGDSLSAIVAFPYTEEIVKKLPETHIFCLADQCNLISEEEKEDTIAIPVLRQRLLDTIYAVQDAPRMHAIFPCQSKHKKCLNLASGFCSNNMCKLCCQVGVSDCRNTTRELHASSTTMPTSSLERRSEHSTSLRANSTRESPSDCRSED